MAYRPMKLSIPPTPDPLFIDSFGGIDYTNTKDLSRSPDGKNWRLDEQMTPEKRMGYKRIFPHSLGTGKVNGLFLFKRKDGSKVKLLHHGTKLYEWDDKDEYKPILVNKVLNGNFADSSNWSPFAEGFTVSANETTQTYSSMPYGAGITQSLGFNAIESHIYYACAKVKILNIADVNLSIHIFDSNSVYVTSGGVEPIDANYNMISCYGAGLDGSVDLNVINSLRYYGSNTLNIKEVVVLDLTEIFGEGNEPTKAYMDTMIGGMAWFEQSVGNPNLIHTGMADNSSKSFCMNDKLYIMDGTNYLAYDGTNVVDVSSIAYVPIITSVKTPDGASFEIDEPINLLSPFVIEAFNGTGVATTFKLFFPNTSFDELNVSPNATPIVGSVDGGVTWDKLETTHFTVNRTTGVITVATPANYPIGTSNIRFKYAVTLTGFADKIKKCRFFDVCYDRVFVSGNPDIPNYDYMSVVNDPTYFPDEGERKFGMSGNPIVGYGNQYNVQIIIKGDDEQDTTVYKRELNLSNPEIDLFVVGNIGNKIGAIASDSTQIINSRLAWLSESGIKILNSTNIADEKNVDHISKRVDKSNSNSTLGLLREDNLKDAISADFDNMYIICLNNKFYIYDYLVDEWYFWDNIPASCFLEEGGYLYFGSNVNGIIYRFKNMDDDNPHSDDGVAIDCYWKPPLLDFGLSHKTKIISKCNYTMKPSSLSSMDFSYATEQVYSDVVQTDRLDLFDFSNIDFSNFTFETNRIQKPITVQLNLRDIVLFQPCLTNKVDGESWGITNLLIDWDIQSDV